MEQPTRSVDVVVSSSVRERGLPPVGVRLRSLPGNTKQLDNHDYRLNLSLPMLAENVNRLEFR
jgi:hypothetical protein